MSDRPSPQPNVLATGGAFAFSASFWLLVVMTGLTTGLAAGLLMRLLRLVQHAAWAYRGGPFLDAVEKTTGPARVAILAATGLFVAVVLLLLGLRKRRHSDALEATIWYRDGALSPWHTTIRAFLSIIVVGLGASLGREAAPKQVGALIGSLLATWRDLPPSQRRLLAACGAGAGIAAVYNVPFAGALFALEVLLGSLSMRLVAPAFVATVTATGSAWLLLPNEPTYHLPAMSLSLGLVVWAVVFAPIAGVASAWFVKLIALVGSHEPKGMMIVPTAIGVFAALGALAIPFPQLLGNGKNVVELAALDRLALPLMLALVLLKPLVTAACLGTGAPGGLFTPTLATGTLLGGVCGHVWMSFWPESAPGAFALIGAGALLAGTTKGPISSLAFMMELTHRIEPLMLPMMIGIGGAVYMSHLIDRRSTYTTRVKPITSLRDCVIEAGLAADAEVIFAVSAATRYGDLLSYCLTPSDQEHIFVIDDSGRVAGKIARRDVVAPGAKFGPLEISTATDFIVSAERRR